MWINSGLLHVLYIYRPSSPSCRFHLDVMVSGAKSSSLHPHSFQSRPPHSRFPPLSLGTLWRAPEQCSTVEPPSWWHAQFRRIRLKVILNQLETIKQPLNPSKKSLLVQNPRLPGGRFSAAPSSVVRAN